MYPDSDPYDVTARDRVYRSATGSSEGRRSFVIVLLTVSIFLLIISVSCRQATEPANARNVLEAGLVTLTDIDQLIADDGPALRQAALDSQEQNVTIPGYPLDIVLTRQEVTGSSDAQLREIILQRSSALVYAEGIGAFDRTGEQSLRRFSIQGVLESGISQVSQSTYDRATLLALISLAGCALFGAITAATGTGWGRMRALGLAAIAAAIPVILMFAFLRFMVAEIGSDDPFVEGYRDVTNSVLGVPLRNGIVVFAAGVAVVVLAMVLGRVERLVSPATLEAIDEEY